MKTSSRDLTQGSIAKQLLLFALPIFAGQIFQNLYNSVDSIIVGQAVGTTALAAVSASSDISMLLVGFFTGLSTGAGVLFSRFFGAKDEQNLHDAIHTAITFSLLFGVLIAGAGIFFSPMLLRVVNCPQDVYLEALDYLRIYLIGVLFTAIYNVGAGVLRAVGDSRTPFIYLVISSCCNIALDIILVALLHLGVSGAALATILSQFISVVLVFRRMLLTQDVYKLIPRDLKIHRALLKDILRLGLPAAIQACLIGLSNVFIQRYINSFGSAAMAGMGAGKRIDRFVGMVAQCLGLATATFVGQNVGAERLDRAFRGIRVVLLVCFSYVLVAGCIVYLLAEPLVHIFTNDENAIAFGVSMIHVMMPFYFCQALNQVFANAVRGFGKSFVVMICSISGMIVCRQIFLAIMMSFWHDIRILYFSFPFGWICASGAVMVYYFFTIRRKYPEEARLRRSA
ncbi:MAG: MATE family efflux transporter [Clostridiaceae bacterium]|nr:MATE family efflux transporter [Clostridiaceae bacterium]